MTNDGARAVGGGEDGYLASGTQMRSLLEEVRRQPILEWPEDGEIYESTVYEAVPWSRPMIEPVLDVTIPPQLAEFWNECRGMELLRGTQMGDLGLILWTAREVEDCTPPMYRGLPPQKFWRGDFIVGMCHGVGEHVVIRGDKHSGDFGSVVILDTPRDRCDWPHVGDSLVDFLRTFMRERRYFWRE
jgi:hypothetical protein